MSVVEEAVFERLSNSTGVTSLVPQTRILPSHLPQDPTLPAITLNRISTQRVSAFGDDTGDVQTRLQASCWGATYTSAKQVAEAVRGSLQRYSSSTTLVRIQDVFLDNELDQPYDERTETYLVTMDFLVWSKES